MVKLYADEAGADAMRGLDDLVVSAITRVEVASAIWRKHRLGELSMDDARVLSEAFAFDFHGGAATSPRFAVVALAAAQLDEAARITATHGLRAYDAVQLAGALAARRADRSCATVACFDDPLRAACAAEGFDLIPSD